MVLQRQWRQIGNQVSKLIARAWLDENFKAQFIANPRRILEEAGIDVPEGVDVRIDQFSQRWSIQQSEDMLRVVWTIPLPPRPADVTDEQVTGWVQDGPDPGRLGTPTVCC